ncbi:M23 family metallopeptidase [Sphingomonas montana]|uniref:M23 family metallopeptidase n=1 Tax=Sphingomonas montana TaxID=1843236 RepID=UPI00096DBC1A|nr:M23 family metallopeptidase [Sphingomonas montana]
MSDQGSGFGSGTAMLSLDNILPARAAGFGRRVEDHVADLELVVDLGADIGSRTWWRGLATCTALCASAACFWPAMPTLTPAAPAPLTAAQWQEARALSIAPLALGADTGRRMAATGAVRPLLDTPERPSIDLTVTLGRGDGFVRVLERSGVGAAEAGAIAAMVAGAVPLADIAPGTRMDVTLGRRADRGQARPLEKLAFRARFDLTLGVTRAGGRLRLVRTPIAVDTTPLRVRGRVGSGLYLAARAAGAPAKAVEAYLRALGSRLSIGRDVAADDRFDIIVEQSRAATGETQVGKLLYAGLDQARGRVQLLEWTIDGRRQWYAASGVGERRGLMRTPVVGRISSGFGWRRHPVLGFSRLHKGMDFAAPYGSPIVAAADGIVRFAGWHGGHGKFVQIQHGGRLGTGYGHMSRIVVPAGTHVAQGQVIGYVGSTGLSTGPHLHYEVYRGGMAINPATISFVTTSQLAGAELGRFRAVLSRLMAIGTGAVTGAGAPLGQSAGRDTPPGA